MLARPRPPVCLFYAGEKEADGPPIESNNSWDSDFAPQAETVGQLTRIPLTQPRPVTHNVAATDATATSERIEREGTCLLAPKTASSLYISRSEESLSLCASVPAGGLAGGAACVGAEEHIYNAFGHISLGSSATLTQSASLCAGSEGDEEVLKRKRKEQTN